ncbi:MAG: hypothetical protein O2954_11390, partial [bacterium]|nr:hypothetical protein [bacterium]
LCEGDSVKRVVLAGVVFRATLLFALPTLSDDLYRYVWDGRVQGAGINPFLHAPISEALAHLRDVAIYPHVNHPEVPTIYPPLAQAFFRLCFFLHPSIWMVKGLLVCVDLLTAWFLLGLIRVFDLNTGRILVYLWNPLLLVEVAGHGHVDILGVFFLIAALLYLHLGGIGRAFFTLALSFLAKFFALCLVPVFWRWTCVKGRGESSLGRILSMLHPGRAWPVLIFPVIVLIGYVPFLEAGGQLFGGLQTYAEHWVFNAPVYDGLFMVLGDGEMVRVVIGVLFGAAVLASALSWMPPMQVTFYLIGIFLLLTPTLHPWYLIWMVPFLVFYRSPAWMGFTGLVVLSYVVLIRYAAEGVWEEAGWVRGVEFGGFVLIWLVSYIQKRRKERLDLILLR